MKHYADIEVSALDDRGAHVVGTFTLELPEYGAVDDEAATREALTRLDTTSHAALYRFGTSVIPVSGFRGLSVRALTLWSAEE